MRKRVLIFALTYIPFVGGAELAVKEITDQLGLDIDFDMITLRFDKKLPTKERVGAITVYRVGFCRKHISISDTYYFPLSLNKYLFPFLAYRKACALHAKHFYHAFWSIQANYAGFAALFTKQALPHVPFILTLQEGDPPAHYIKRVGILEPLYRSIFRYADIVQAISTFLAQYAHRMGHEHDIEVIPNGVSVRDFARKPTTKEITAFTKRFSKGDDDVYLVTVSRLVKKNAVDDIIRALAHLPTHVKLLVIGDGPEGEALWKLAVELGVEKRVWFGGHIPHGELPLYLHSSDIFVRPSRSEGMGNAFIEAMAAGLPVIATPVGGIPDFLYDPDKKSPIAVKKDTTRHLGSVTPTGLFCKVNNPESIAAAVKRLLDDPKLRERLAENASGIVRTKYDWHAIAASMRQHVFGKIFSTSDK